MPKQPRSVFWDDVERQLEDPDFRRHFVLEQNRIETVDPVMNLITDSALARSQVRPGRMWHVWWERTPRAIRLAAQPRNHCPQPDPRDPR